MKKAWTEVPAGTLNAATQRFWVALGNNAETVATMINTKPGFVDKLAKFAEKYCVSKSASWDRAREIMGKNFFGVEEAVKHFGVKPGKGNLAGLCDIPWSEEVLESVKDTHILVAFCKKGESAWHLVRKTPVDDSTSKAWLEQQELPRENEQVPTSEVMEYVVNGYFKETGERLFENGYVRTSSVGSDDWHIYVGGFGTDGLCVDNSISDDVCYSGLGLASELKKP